MSNIPEDFELERAILASACAPGRPEDAWKVSLGLTAEDFQAPQHRALFQALGDVLAEGQDGEVDAHRLRAALETKRHLGLVGGFPGLVEILASEEIYNLDGPMARLRDLAQRRQLLRAVYEAQTAVDRGEHDAPEVMQALGEQLHRIQVAGAKVRASGWSDMLHRIALEEPFRPEGFGSVAGFWGIDELDKVASIPAGEPTLIAARPGIGKTALGVQVAAESAIQGKRVLYVSLELEPEILESRVASYFLDHYSSLDFQRGEYSSTLARQLAFSGDALGRGETLGLPIGTPWPVIEAEIRQRHARHGLDLVVVDYFSYIGRPPVQKGGNEAYAYGAVSEAITRTAKGLGIGIVLLAQLVKDADGKEPALGELADSDRPARDAALALLVWRDAKGSLQARMKKNRHNPEGLWRGELFFPSRGCKLKAREHETAQLQMAACGARKL